MASNLQSELFIELSVQQTDSLRDIFRRTLANKKMKVDGKLYVTIPESSYQDMFELMGIISRCIKDKV